MDYSLTSLSPAERIYYSDAAVIEGKPFEQLKREAIKLMHQEEAQAQQEPAKKIICVDVPPSLPPVPEPAKEMICVGTTVRTLRRAIRTGGGRPKASEEEKQTAQERREQRADKERKDRALNLELKEQKRRRAQEKAERDRRILQQIKQEEERVKRLSNIAAAAKVSPTGGDIEGATLDHPNYHLITTGILAIPGKIGVVIDSKNTIYVKTGADIDAAVAKHFTHRKIASIF